MSEQPDRPTPEEAETWAQYQIDAGLLGEPMTGDEMRAALHRLKRLGDRAVSDEFL